MQNVHKALKLTFDAFQHLYFTDAEEHIYYKCPGVFKTQPNFQGYIFFMIYTYNDPIISLKNH